MLHERLTQYLHRAIDTQPAPVLALRVSSPTVAVTWTTQRDTLSLAWGTDTTRVDLAGQTLESLAALCRAVGLETPYVHVDAAIIPAVALMPGTGNSYSSNGDHLYISANPVLLLQDAQASALQFADADLLEALAQMDPLASEGEWADLWGWYFGVARRDGESDAEYTQRIFVEVIRPRNNPYAIEETLTEALGMRVYVSEPWTRVMHLSGYAPALSRHRLRDRMFWTHATLVATPETEDVQATLEALRPLVQQRRPGGVFPYFENRREIEIVNEAATAAIEPAECQQLGPLSSQRVDWMAGALPPGGAEIGNEAWIWGNVGADRVHVSGPVDGQMHWHGVEGFAAKDCPATWRLFAHVWLDPEAPPEALLVGWQTGAGWMYARWGADVFSEAPCAYGGALPLPGAWAEVSVPPIDLGLPGGLTASGLMFGLFGGKAAFGPSGMMRDSVAVATQERVEAPLLSSPGAYHIMQRWF